MQKATQNQKELIVKLASEQFGNIYSNGFVKFSEWLLENTECFSIDDLCISSANSVISALQNMQRGDKKQSAKNRASNTSNIPFWESVMRAAAKIYLKGFYEGQISKNETPPSIDDIIENIRRELDDSRTK